VQFAKLLVTIGLLTFLLLRVDLAKLGDVIQNSDAGWLCLALVIYSLLLITSTWKWDRLLRAVGVIRGFGSLLRFYTVGFFFSSFLPGNVGGDLVRWHLASGTPSLRLRVGATILAERITGVVTLVALCCLLVAGDRARLATPATTLLLGCAVAGLLAGLWLAWDSRLAERLLGGFRGRAGRILGALHRLHRALNDIPRRALVAAVWNSLPFYAAAGLLFYLIGQALGAEITFLEATSVQVLISLLTLVPISLGGLGLAQAGDVYLLGLLGVDAPTALAMSLIRQAGRYVYAALGGVLFVRWPGHPKVSELRSMSDARQEAVASVDIAGH
jgi:uncharacterized protein (TIRG00374 family)